MILTQESYEKWELEGINSNYGRSRLYKIKKLIFHVILVLYVKYKINDLLKKKIL